MFLLKYLLILVLMPFILLAAYRSENIKLISQKNDALIYKVTSQTVKLDETINKNNEIFHSISFNNAIYPENNNAYRLPSQIYNIIIPENGDLSVQVTSQTQRSINNVNLKKSDLYRDQEDLSVQRPLVELGPISRFRDFTYRSLQINNVDYNVNSKTATIIDNLTLNITISGNTGKTNPFKLFGELDKIYKDMFVNFDEAKNWQIQRQFSFPKKSSLNDDIFYRIKVIEDGIYKVTSSFLKNSGIDTDGININSLQLYNNGGHQLSLATTVAHYNPSFTQETAILVYDLNQNNLFDGNDYFLFYGKSLNGWYFDYITESFKHQEHTFDTENWYYLSINGSSGKRIAETGIENISGLPTEEFFIERFHYENEIYNPIQSGPSWYGHRFYGRNGSHTLNFSTDNIYASGPQANLEIKMKGGSKVHWDRDDRSTYRYYFDIYLNNSLLNFAFHNSYTLQNYLSKLDNELFDPTLLSNSNSLKFVYSSSNEKSTVYLDWLSLYYPKESIASNNYLSFFADADIFSKNMHLSGFESINDLHLLDVTDPLNAELLVSNASPTSGSYQFTVPETWISKKLIAFSLTSSSIKSVTQISAYNPKNNLLNTNKSADLIIITRNSFLEYAEEIAELRRDHLQVEVASIEDINFYFNNGVQDPTAIRNFLRYAYYNWQSGSALSYVLLFGDGHYDYRNIVISDSIIVPTFQLFSEAELQSGEISRESDIFYGQLETNDNTPLQNRIVPSIAVGRLPIENSLDAERMVEKLRIYKENPIKDGWQTNITFVADDNIGHEDNEYEHQNHTEVYARKLTSYLQTKIYSTAYEDVPGGLGKLKPVATQELIDQINRGTLLINYSGHGSPTQWAGESIFNFDRDYNKINNDSKFPFIVAATCDFGIFDNPNNSGFCEALIWKEKSGVIGVLAATRLVYANQNHTFSGHFFDSLFPENAPSNTLGVAFVSALGYTTGSNYNDQKFHLLADPSMKLADANQKLEILSVSHDTLKALSEVEIQGQVFIENNPSDNFNGGAVLIVHDAAYEDIHTGGLFYDYEKNGPLIFKGEVSVEDGLLNGNFIVPKSIRYQLRKTGRITFYAWDNETNETAGGYIDTLLFFGSSTLPPEPDGPDIDIYFENYENFETGDMLPVNPVLIAELKDESGINITGQLGHKIEIQVDDDDRIDISESFVYNRDSYKDGFIHYPITSLSTGEHTLFLQAYDNLNNRSEQQVTFTVIASNDMVLADVVNYPNPFRQRTDFTFRTNVLGAEYSIKIYTISGRLIEKLEGITDDNYNSIPWNGVDRDGNELGNGVYLYKITLKQNGKVKEKIEKMVVLK